MTAPTIRTDYDQLKQVAAAFQQNVAATQQTLRAIQQNKATLQGGDWVGQGANAFYREMDDSVLPTFQRLINALDAAANSTTQISAFMKDAEDQAARVLKGTGGGAGAGGGPGMGAGAAGLPGADGGSAGQSSFTAAGASAGGSSASAGGPNGSSPTPPDIGASIREQLEEGAGSVGMVAEIVSILEAGGSIEAAGIGTTMGAFALPIGAFFLGTAIAERQERAQQAVDVFKMKLKGQAQVASTHQALAQLQAKGIPVRELNADGIAAVKALGDKWKDQMDEEINMQLMQDAAVIHGHIDKLWQSHYDDWVNGMSKDLANIYANRLMTK